MRLALGNAEWQCNRGEDDDSLPSPKRESGELVKRQAYVTGSLDDVIGGCEKRRSAECEYHGIGVQWSEPAVGQEGQVEIQRGPDELGRYDESDKHTDDAPDDRHDRELAHNLVVVARCVGHRFFPGNLLLVR